MPDFHRSARLSWGFLHLTAFVCALAIVGCASWRGTEPKVANPFVSYYDKLAREVAEPDLSIRSQAPPPSLGEGRSLTAPNPEDRWLLTLAEAIRLGLENNSVIRQNAQFMSPNNPVMQSADSVASIFDPVIQNNGVLFGQRGTDAALSDFDPRLTNTTKMIRDENVQNITINAPPNNVLATEGLQYQTRLEQQLLSGGIFGINNKPDQHAGAGFPPAVVGGIRSRIHLDCRAAIAKSSWLQLCQPRCGDCPYQQQIDYNRSAGKPAESGS